MVCKKCGAELEQGTQFCAFCGTSVTNENNSIVCPKCGAEMSSDAMFCAVCGTSLVQNGASSVNVSKTRRHGGKVLLALITCAALIIGGVLGVNAIQKMNGSHSDTQNTKNGQNETGLYEERRQQDNNNTSTSITALFGPGEKGHTGAGRKGPNPAG